MTTDDDIRQRLLECGGQVFAERGFEAANVREICERAGVYSAAINYYFGGKENFYKEALKRAHQCRLEQAPLPAWPAGTPPAEKLRAFIRVLTHRLLDKEAPAWFMQLMLRELANPSEAGRELVREFIKPHFELLVGILGEILPPAVPAEKKHLIAFSIVGQCFYHRVAAPVITILVGKAEHKTYTPERVADHIAEFTLAALGREAANHTPQTVN